MIRIAVREASGRVREMTFDHDRIVVGRAPQNELCITGKGVSGRHCQITRDRSGYVIEDLRSTNGTFVNRQRLAAPQRIGPGDEVVVAMFSLRMLDSPPTEQRRAAKTEIAQLEGPPLLSAYGLEPAVPQPVGPAPASGPAMVAPAAVANPASTPVPAAPVAVIESASTPVPVAPASRAPSGVSSPEDAVWAREWEKIDIFTREWLLAGKDRSALLRGEKLAHARRWLASARGKSPPPRPEQRAFVIASLRAKQGRIARNIGVGGILAGATSVAIVVLGPAVFGIETKEDKVDQGSPATSVADKKPEGPPQRSVAERRRRADALVEMANLELEEGQAERATLLAIEAWMMLPETDRGSKPERLLRNALTHLRGVPLRGHEQRINQVTITADRRWAVTASDDRTARVWDLRARSIVPSYTLRGHFGPVTNIAVTRDGRKLFTAADDMTMFRWDLTHDQPHVTSEVMRGQDSAVTAMDVSEDGQMLVTGGRDGSVWVWNVGDGPPSSSQLKAHQPFPVTAVAIAENGAYIASAGEDAKAFVWEISDGAVGRRKRLEAHESAVLDIDIAPDGSRVITGSKDGSAKLWDPSRGAPVIGHVTLLGHENASVERVAITGDSKLAITVGSDERINVWDLEAKAIEQAAVTFDLHKDAITDLATFVPPPGEPGTRYAFSASRDKTARTWNLDRRAFEQDSVVLEGHDAPVTAVAPSPDGHFLITGAEDGSARIWDHATKTSGGASFVARGHGAQVLDVAVNAVGTRLVTASADGTSRVWDLTKAGPALEIGRQSAHEGRVRTAAIDPEGRYAATAGEDGVIHLWDLNLPDPADSIRQLLGHRKPVLGLSFTADRKLVSISSDRTARIWNLRSTSETQPLVLQHRDELQTMATSRDGRWLMTGTISQLYLWDLKATEILESGKVLDHDGRLHEEDILATAVGPKGKFGASSSVDPALVLWDFRHGIEAVKLRKHDEAVDAIAFDPTGHWLATGSRDRTIRLWDLSAEHPEEVSLELKGHQQRIASLQFSADGKRLLSASNDTSVRLWNLESGDEATINADVDVFRGHGDVVTKAMFNQDETLIVTASYDGTARVWPLTRDALVQMACRRAGRDLSEAEWEEFMKGETFLARCLNLR